MYIVRYARRHSSFSLGLGLAVSNFQFWIGHHSVAQGLGLAVSIFQLWIVYHTFAQERDRGSRCG